MPCTPVLITAPLYDPVLITAPLCDPVLLSAPLCDPVLLCYSRLLCVTLCYSVQLCVTLCYSPSGATAPVRAADEWEGPAGGKDKRAWSREEQPRGKLLHDCITWQLHKSHGKQRQSCDNYMSHMTNTGNHVTVWYGSIFSEWGGRAAISGSHLSPLIRGSATQADPGIWGEGGPG